MSETLAQRLAAYSNSLRYSDLPKQLVTEAKRRVIDTLGVCYASFDAPPVRAARDLAAESTSKHGATVLGSWVKAPVDHAVFANGCAARYLDFNDTYLSKEALHPSDNIPAVLGAAEAEQGSGRDLIVGTVLAYDLCCALADASSIRNRGWDHVTYVAISAALGAAKAMDLNVEQTTHAINLAATPNVALRQTRAGELSMWKGCAAANAARNGVFACLLAKRGVTGPAPVFEGEMGFFKQVSGDFTLKLGESHKLPETHIKYYPVEYHAMSAVDAANTLREQIAGSEIDFVTIETFTVGWQIIAKDPEKWSPKTKETADHSLPYIVATTLLHGPIWLDSYLDWAIQDDKTRSLLARTKVVVKEEYDRMYPDSTPVNIRVKMKDGRTLENEVVYPKGHYRNPLSDEELETKFLKLGGPKDSLETLWSLENRSLDDVLEALVRRR
ncbi:MAG: MmgE/PrpD family protein [Thermoprotei archaeon]